jgi:outer membrane receptor protein involved in Fe transport
MLREMFFALCLMVLIGGPLFGQTATISGTVTDQSSAVIPGAEATVANTETGSQRLAVSDERGRFAVPQLPPGRYQVTVVKEGFETLVRSGITLTVGQDAHLSLALTVGAVTQQVTISAEAPLVDTSTSAVTGQVDMNRIQDLPLNGRDFTQLALVGPAVIAARKTDSIAQKGFGARISMAGSRADQTGWLLDGTNIKSMSNFGTPGSASGLMLGVDAVREFQVLTSNYSAEYGGGSGGFVNMVTKSGTNEMHGSAYEFHRNDNLDAARWEANAFGGGRKPEFKRNQYGFSLGGPIQQDKTFVFGNYESLRERLGITTVSAVPDDNAHQGLIPGRDANGNFILVPVQIAASVKPYLDLWPRANGDIILDPVTRFPSGTANLTTVASDKTDQHYLVTRADHRLTDNQTIFGRFTVDQGDKTRPHEIPITNNDIITRTRYVTVQHEGIWSPQLLSSTRIAYNRTNLGSTVSLNIDYPQNLFIFNKSIPPSFSYPGVSGFGPSDRDAFGNVQNLYQAQQNFIYSSGTHSIKFGADYQKVGINTDGGPRDSGSFGWNSVREFLEDRTLNGFSLQVPGGQSQRSFVQHVTGLYFQDDWKWRPNFTWNLGLRYEPFTPPSEKWDRISVVKDWVTATEFDTDVPFWDDPSKKNFSPRVGFAWDPQGDGKTAVRGGFGLFYVVLTGASFRTPGVKNPPFSAFIESNITNSNLASAVADVNAIAPTLLPKRMTPLTFMEITQWDLDPSYEIKFNFTVERELPGNLSVSLGYIGGRGNHLWRNANANAAPSSFTEDGREFVAPNTTRINRNTGVGTTRYSDTKSFYNAMLFAVKKRLSQGFTVQSSYTWSKTVDDATTGVANTDYQEGTSLHPYNTKGSRGLSAIHLGQNLTLNGVWAIPFPQSSGLVTHILGGWQLSGIFTASDGTPFSVSVSGRVIPDLRRETGNRPDWAAVGQSFSEVISEGNVIQYFDPTVFVLAPANTYGNSGRNTLIGPGFVNFDLNLKKGFPVPLGEASRLEFTGGFFNLLNRPSFSNPDSSIWNGSTRQRIATAGRITATRNEARQIQLGLKLIF